MTDARAVTMVVSDLQGSTALAERLDSETVRAVLRRYFDEMTIVVESHGGVVAKIIGDAYVAVFDGDDDPAVAARNATRAAIGAQAALSWLNDRFEAVWGVRLRNRTGVASGTLPAVTVRDRRADGDVLTGEVLSRAEVLEATAPAMEVLVDARTRALAGDAAATTPVGPVHRAGAGTVAEAWRVVSVDAPDADPASGPASGAGQRCPGCGTSTDAGARWCAACGRALVGDPTRESRRVVTILFAAARPDTDDGERPTADVVRSMMARWFAVVRPILERHGATVEKFIGDATMAVFGLPVRHEDDALRAVRAAHDMHAAMRELNDELSDRFGVALAQPIGVNTGAVVAGDAVEGQRLVTGDAVNVAARFEQTAGPHDIVIGDLTRRLVGDLVVAEPLAPLQLKGKAEPVPAHRVTDVVVGGTRGRRHDLPLVGRDDELAALRTALRDATRTRRAQRITLVGDAGVGKSRLMHEFLAEAGRTARILQGRCLSYGEGITFWALLEVVQDAAGITEDDDATTARRRLTALVGDEPDVLARLESIAGLGDVTYAVAELGWALRRLIERLADDGPVLLVLDDVHWAEPTLVEVIQRLANTVEGCVLLLCAARPQVLQQHRAFVADARSVVLAPLTATQCERFLLLLLGDVAVDPSIVRRIAGAAGGNPLFLEQFLLTLIDDGRLERDDDGWHATGDLTTLEVPASIEALLAGRLDRLPHDERRISGPCAVIGLEFLGEAVAALVEGDLRPRVPDGLARLAGRELIEPADAPEPTYRFQHELIRDATYQGLLKASRAVLHQRFVAWLDARDETRDRGTELQEIQGYHLEQAYSCWRALGPPDRRVIDVGIDAARRLGAAGERALARGDMPAAAALLLRAADLLPDGHDASARLLLLAGGALDEAGLFDRALEAFDAAAAAARAAGSDAGVEAATVARSRLEYLTGRAAEPDQVGRRVEEALDRLTALADPDALSRAWQLRLDVDIAACRWAAAQHAAEQVISHARQAGNAMLALRTMRSLAFLAQKGPMPVVDATTVCLDVLDQVASDRRSAAITRVDLALLTAMRLDFASARRWCADARGTLDELGADVQAALVSLTSGPIELLADQPTRAEAELRRDHDALADMGERNFISLTAALLAEAVYRQRRFAEAEELISFSLDLAAPDDLAVRIVAGSIHGKLVARGGDPTAGVTLLREAVRLIEATEDPSGQADAWLDLAEALHLAGEQRDAVEATGKARRRYVAKGNLAGVRRADRIRRRLRAGRDPLGTPGARSTWVG